MLRAADGEAELALETPASLTNVIAMITTAEDADAFQRVVPLGAVASLEFLAPARGRLVANCRLDDQARQALRPVLSGDSARARLTTRAEVVDAVGELVCRGRFDWSVRRT
ncbi:hypothetical protein [Streptomyces lunaelactis]|uniref:hypothetical protein n=1 Tax=Streptomyces lunaelactis TaxID=1535768 RepID=UPI002815A3F6|nr:hypothetical protein [Streptomyces lunaelactis]